MNSGIEVGMIFLVRDRDLTRSNQVSIHAETGVACSMQSPSEGRGVVGQPSAAVGQTTDFSDLFTFQKSIATCVIHVMPYAIHAGLKRLFRTNREKGGKLGEQVRTNNTTSCFGGEDDSTR